jgi:tetratricopeptide (TPR) repeat protein
MEGCIAASKRGVALDPLNVLPRWLLGNFYLYSGQLDEAEKTYKAVLELDPNHSESVRMLGDVYRYSGEPGKALEYAERAYDIQSGRGFSSSSLAQAYILHGRVEDARRVLDKQIDEASRGHVLAAISRPDGRRGWKKSGYWEMAPIGAKSFADGQPVLFAG